MAVIVALLVGSHWATALIANKEGKRTMARAFYEMRMRQKAETGYNNKELLP